MKQKLEFIMGPCVIESESMVLHIAEALKKGLEPYKNQINLTFKASFDKANRTSVNSFRGPGMEEGLRILERVRKDFSLPILTDFHHHDQAEPVASVVDILQVPAFLCRQTDMIVEGAKASKKYNRILNIKKGQFLSPEDTGNIVDKAASILPKDKIFLTERGVSFGYNNLIVDMASFQVMKAFGVRTIYDATHSVQRPGGLGTATGGKREQVEVLSRAAVAAGADGIFIETHPEPTKALSDASTSLPLKEIPRIVDTLVRIHGVL